jgi:hypothetical protein
MISFLDQQESVFAAFVEPFFHVVRAAVVPATHALGLPQECLLLALCFRRRRPAGTANRRTSAPPVGSSLHQYRSVRKNDGIGFHVEGPVGQFAVGRGTKPGHPIDVANQHT